VYDRLVTHQIVHARSAAVGAARNQALLEVAEGYFDLLSSHAALAIAGETKSHAERLVNVIESFAKRGAGRTSYRALTEYQFRSQQERLAKERTVIVAATLARRLHLDPRVQLIPLDKHIVPIDLFPMECDPNSLVDIALQHRPEIEEGRWLLSSAVHRADKARLAPLLPQLMVGYGAGGFGGGYAGSPDGFFDDLGSRQDLQASAIWQLKNLGFGDRYRLESQQLELENGQLQLARMVDKVSEEVVAAHETVVSRREQMTATRLAVSSAIDSVASTVTRIREGTALPIEALQSIQVLDRARLEYLHTLTAYNKAQFRLLNAIGDVPPQVDDTH
jgi:outer membrane protein TolC